MSRASQHQGAMSKASNGFSLSTIRNVHDLEEGKARASRLAGLFVDLSPRMK